MTLEEFFKKHNKIALAFSGGVDSAYLLYAGIKYGADIKPFYVRSQFQPEFEKNDALRLAEELGAEADFIEFDVLGCQEIRENPPNRCYYCKTMIMATVKKAAAEKGYNIIIDGTNFSDDVNDRPGMQALKEFGVLSPLRLCGLTKSEIRKLSREAGLFTWCKPAYACLATRIPAGQEITAHDLIKTEKAENILFNLGFSDFRVRLRGSNALVQLTENDLVKASRLTDVIKLKLGQYFDEVMVDQKAREVSL